MLSSPNQLGSGSDVSGLPIVVAGSETSQAIEVGSQPMVTRAFVANGPESRVCWSLGWVSAACAPFVFLAGWLEASRAFERYDLFERYEWLMLVLLVPAFLGVLASIGAFFVGLAELCLWLFSRKQQPTCWRTLAGMGFACLLPFALIPTTTVSSDASLRVNDMNTLRQIALASLNYESARGYFPPLSGSLEKPDSKGQGLSWRVHILPFLDQDDLYQRFRLDEPWDSPHNIQLLEEMPEIYASCWPLQQPPAGHTLYQRPVGHGAFDPGDRKGIRLGQITDGTSDTILAVQVDTAFAVPWTKPTDYIFDPSDPTRGLGHVVRYPSWLAARCDGSVDAVDGKGKSVKAVRAMFTRDAGDQTPENWY